MPVFNSTLAKRRRFQPPITTYFASVPESDASGTHSHYAAATFSPTPVVSAKVQASLLSVGMRVRKSVADGYKTRLEMEKEKAAPAIVGADAPTTQAYGNYGSHAELTSFAGTHRYLSHMVTDDDGDAFSLPSSSQESNASAPFTRHNGQKRQFDFDNDIFADDDTYIADAGEDSGRDISIGRTILSPSLGQQRRRAFAVQQKSSAVGGSGVELDDFEEASFLRRREEVDNDYNMDCS